MDRIEGIRSKLEVYKSVAGTFSPGLMAMTGSVVGTWHSTEIEVLLAEIDRLTAEKAQMESLQCELGKIADQYCERCIHSTEPEDCDSCLSCGTGEKTKWECRGVDKEERE